MPVGLLVVVLMRAVHAAPPSGFCVFEENHVLGSGRLFDGSSLGVAGPSGGEFTACWVGELKRFECAQVLLNASGVEAGFPYASGDAEDLALGLSESGRPILALSHSQEHLMFAQLLDLRDPSAQPQDVWEKTNLPKKSKFPFVASIPGGFIVIGKADSAYIAHLENTDSLPPDSFFHITASSRLRASTLQGSNNTVFAWQEGALVEVWLVDTALAKRLSFPLQPFPGRSPEVFSVSKGFVLLWLETTADVVQGRLYDESGTELNSFKLGNGRSPSAAQHSSGDVVVVWIGDDGDGDGVLAQVFDADMNKKGSVVVINTDTQGDQTRVSVAIRDDFLAVVWSNDRQQKVLLSLFEECTTHAPPTLAPPTLAPPTAVPPTSSPATDAPETLVPTTAPLTSAPFTAAPLTAAPATSAPPTSVPVSQAPQTTMPATLAPTEEVHKKQVREAVDGVALGAAALGAGQATAVVLLAQGCQLDKRDEGELPLLLHPTQLRVDGNQYVGVVLGNLAVSVGFTVLGYVLVLVVRRCGLSMLASELDAQGLLRFPSAPLFVFQVLYQGTVLGAVHLLLGGGPWMLGIVTLAVCFAVPVMVFYVVKKDVPSKAKYLSVWEAEKGGKMMECVNRGRYLTFLLGPGEWVSVGRHNHWVRRWAGVVRSYRQGIQWFSIVEFMSSLSLAAVSAVETESRIQCGHVRVAMTAILLLSVVCTVWTNPFARGRDVYLVGGVLVLQAGAACSAAMGFYGEETGGGDTAFQASSVLLLGATVLLLLKTALDVVSELHVILTGSRTALQDSMWLLRGDKTWMERSIPAKQKPAFNRLGSEARESLTQKMEPTITAIILTEDPYCSSESDDLWVA